MVIGADTKYGLKVVNILDQNYIRTDQTQSFNVTGFLFLFYFILAFAFLLIAKTSSSILKALKVHKSMACNSSFW